jgi:CheY-like chemotaxis protein
MKKPHTGADNVNADANHSPRPILIAEDDPFDLTLLKNTLSVLEISNPVLSFSDGADVIRYLDPAPAARVVHGLPALLLLDLKMQEMDGFAVIETLRQHACFAELPIVAITGLASPREIARALKLGANGYVFKPIDPVTLQRIMGEFCFAANGS